MSLTGKRALVTGGSRGIGAAIAQALAANGADVAITYQNSAEYAESIVASIEKLGRRGLGQSPDWIPVFSHMAHLINPSSQT